MSNGSFSRPKNKIVAGVCAGIANSMNLDAVWVRLGYFILTIITGGIPGVIVYAILWAVMPEE